MWYFIHQCSVLTLLVGWEEGHLACKTLGVGGVVIWLALCTSYSSMSPPLPSSLASITLANPCSPGKMAIKMERECRANIYLKLLCKLYQHSCNDSCFWQEIQHTQDFMIKPADSAKKLETSEWPLLLKVSIFVVCNKNCHENVRILLKYSFTAYMLILL